MKTIVLHGCDKKGFDTKICYSMEDVKAFLRHSHHEYVHAYINGCWEKHFIVPKGIGVRFNVDA